MARRIGTSSSSQALRKKILHELEKEGEKMLQSMLKDFSGNLAQESQKILQTLTSDLGKITTGGQHGGLGLSNFSGIFSSLLNYALYRPRTHVLSKETSRSREMERAFRLSAQQRLAATQEALGESTKNN